MKILDNLAINIADRVNAKNDAVMLLTQENELLQQKLAASELTVSDYQKKIKKSDNQLKVYKDEWRNVEKEKERLESKYTEVKKRLKDLAESGERQVDTIQDYAEQINKLQNSKPDKKLKQRNKELEEQLEQSEKMRKLNYSLSEAKSFVADKRNKDKLIECLSHNLKLYADENELTFSQLGEAYEVSRETARRIYAGERGTSVTTFELMESDMCAYFECMPLELVTEKVEGKEC